MRSGPVIIPILLAAASVIVATPVAAKEKQTVAITYLLAPKGVPAEGLRAVAVIDAGGVAEAEDLISTAVGEDGAVPLHEPVQPPQAPYYVAAGPQRQVVGVGEDDLCPQGAEPLGQHGLDRALGSNRHEARRPHRTTWSLQQPGAGPAVGGLQPEGEIGKAVNVVHVAPPSRVSPPASRRRN